MDTCTHHTWTPTDNGNFACEDCPELIAACHTCGQRPADPNAACNRCLNRARQTLADIRLALDHPMAPILPLRAIRYDRNRGGSSDYMPFGIGTELDDPDVLKAEMARTSRTVLELTRDPDTLTDTLSDWAEAWAEARNETLPADWLDYLHTRTTWAANTPDTSGWHDYHQEARTIRTRLWNIVGLNPQTEVTPCVYCQSPLIRRWESDGLADEIRCTNRDCEKKTYRDQHELEWLNRTYIRAAPVNHPNTEVTREQISLIYPDLKQVTFRQWVHKKELAPVGTTPRGQETYLLADVEALHARAYKTAGPRGNLVE